MSHPAPGERFRSLSALAGPRTACLRLGDWRLHIDGLDDALRRDLGRRWGGFLEGPGGEATCRIAVLDAGAESWLSAWQPGEEYRIETLLEGDLALTCSYYFAVGALERGGFGVALTTNDREPRERTLENAVRFLAARLALDRGGFALHGAGVLDDGRAHLFCGSSGSGKSTAVRLSAPRPSLGDDFTLTVPGEGERWLAPAVPFDNSERAGVDPPRGWFEVAGLHRLVKSDHLGLEKPAGAAAAASLLNCVAFPWAFPREQDRLLAHVERFIDGGGFRHLLFGTGDDIWRVLSPAGSD